MDDTTGTTVKATNAIFSNALAKSGNATAIEEWAAARRKKAIEVVGGDDEDCESIDGKKVVLHFYQPHCGWEMDQHCWLTEDGRVWATNHGSLYEMSPEELAELDEQVAEWARGVHAAREAARKLRGEGD